MWRRAVVGVVIAVGQAACFSHPVTVVSAASPDPFVGQHKYVLLPMDHSRAITELQLGVKNPDETRALTELNQAMEAFEIKFAATLIERAHELDYDVVPASVAPKGAFEIRPRLEYLNPGLYEYLGSTHYGRVTFTDTEKTPSHAAVRVEIVSPDDRRDELTAEHSQQGAIILARTPVDRAKMDGFGCGMAIAQYLKSRIGD